jgi:hypothetical protein
MLGEVAEEREGTCSGSEHGPFTMQDIADVEHENDPEYILGW